MRSEMVNAVAVDDGPFQELSVNVEYNSSPFNSGRRAFGDMASGMGMSVDTKDIITPPNSTIRGTSKEIGTKRGQPLSPKLSSPISHTRAKRQKSEHSGNSRSNGNLTLDELVDSFANRYNNGELLKKPPYSYATLISLAILQSDEGKLTLSQIYSWISVHFPYYKQRDAGWQNSIRHNLSLNEAFVKTQKSGDGKGHFWEVKAGHEIKFFKNETGSVETIRRKLKTIENFFQLPSDSVNEIGQLSDQIQIQVPVDTFVTNDQSHFQNNIESVTPATSSFSNINSSFFEDERHEQKQLPKLPEIGITPDFTLNLSPLATFSVRSDTAPASKYLSIPTLDQNYGSLINPYQTKKFNPVLNNNMSYQKIYDKHFMAFDNANDAYHEVTNSSNLLESPHRFNRYTSSFNSSFEETSPNPYSSQPPQTTTTTTTTNETQEQNIHLPTLAPSSKEIMHTPNITDTLEKTPIRFATTPRDDNALLMNKWQTPSNIFEDFYASPLFKGIGTPLKFAAISNTSKILSPNGKLATPQHMKESSSRSRLSTSGLFGVDMYSVWKRATGNAQPSDVSDTAEQQDTTRPETE